MDWRYTDLWIRMFPELHLFESERERYRALRAAAGLTHSRRFFYFLLFILAFVSCWVPARLRWRKALPWWIARPAAVLIGVAAGSLFMWLTRRDVQRHLRQQLIDKGIPVCLNCGYHLRGLSEPRCPECGKPFDPKLLDKVPRDSDPE